MYSRVLTNAFKLNWTDEILFDSLLFCFVVSYLIESPGSMPADSEFSPNNIFEKAES